MFKRIIILAAMACLSAVILCACGGSALEQAADELDEKNQESKICTVVYSSDTDTLKLSDVRVDDKHTVMKTVNKYTKGQEIGNVIINDSDSAEIGRLKCKSMKIFQIDDATTGNGKGEWLKPASKAKLVVLDNLPNTRAYSDDSKEYLAKIKRIWLEGSRIENAAAFSGLEELGISANMNIEPKEEGDTSGEQEKEKGELFSGFMKDFEKFYSLKEAPNLKRILIIPTALSYRLPDSDTDDGSKYMAALKYLRPETLVNEPGKELDIDPVEGVSDDDLIQLKNVKIPDNDNYSWQVNEWQKYESKMCYKKGKKNKEQKKTPVVYGKALVHDAYAGLKGEFTSKHKYIFSGNSLHANEIKGSFETADESSDYQTFIYVYPLYTYYGTYTSGTKGYTVTEYAQVFDLARGITYAPVKIASDNPPQSFKYPQGQVPTQKTGQVSQEKIYKYLRGLKCEKAK